MNLALIAKVGWRVIHDDSSLWARVVRSKYKVGSIDDRSWTKTKGTWSSTWRSVAVGLREVVYEGMRWVIGDGKKIHFWTDKWLLEESLIERVVAELPADYVSLKASDIWSYGMGWDLAKITPYVSDDRRLELAAVVIDNITGATDRLAWGETPDGKFTVKSAYSMLTREEGLRQDMGTFYTRVWGVIAPERVRVFFRLIGNQAIMTNQERFRRHLSDTDICQVCKGGVESILHVLRDCPAMVGIWNRIVPRGKRRDFFNGTLLEWIYENLRGGVETIDGSWSTIFDVAVWWGWKWRCGNVFGGNKLCRDRVRVIKD